MLENVRVEWQPHAPPSGVGDALGDMALIELVLPSMPGGPALIVRPLRPSLELATVMPALRHMLASRNDWRRRLLLGPPPLPVLAPPVGDWSAADKLLEVRLDRLAAYARYMTAWPVAKVLDHAFRLVEALVPPSPMRRRHDWQRRLGLLVGGDADDWLALGQVLPARDKLYQSVLDDEPLQPLIRALYFRTSIKEYEHMTRTLAVGYRRQRASESTLHPTLSSLAELAQFLPPSQQDWSARERLRACLVAAVLGFDVDRAGTMDAMLALGREQLDVLWAEVSAYIDARNLPEEEGSNS